MNEGTAARMMRDLMTEHGLTGWRFGLDGAKRRHGQCRYATHTIALSRTYVRLNDEPEVRGTILHEVAHALVGPGHGHGAVWRAMARKVGAPTARCGSADAVMPEGKWALTCERCGKIGDRHRRGKRGAMYKHNGCGGLISWRPNDRQGVA